MRLKSKYKTLRLILGDQLNAQHSWYKHKSDDVLYLIAELKQETDYVKHHVQKICAFFAAMDNFATALRSAGHHVCHLTLDDTVKYADLTDLLIDLCQQKSIEVFAYQAPDEYRLREQLKNIDEVLKLDIEKFDTEHFILPTSDMDQYVKAGKHNRLESFYRKLRVRFDILMDGDKPVGGQWNYDSENRSKLKPVDLESLPDPLVFDNNITPILKRLDKHKVKYFGDVAETIVWPVSRSQSLKLLNHFCKYCLPKFGQFQDAMTAEHTSQWSLFHSRLSFALNSKMLHPQQVIDTAIKAYEKADGEITLPQIEGFVRQILGWREYVRCVYWMNMPRYAEKNELKAKRPLPSYYWNAKTRMRCMQHAIGQSLQYAYAHHIQRLMITGNFALLAGINPEEVDEWYLGVYVDAIEWVEMPNTRGMSQFADGGWVATKPYASGGNYINKMSDYCKGCYYNVKDKTSDSACPFNSLYWHFMDRHRTTLEKNPRIGMIYRNWDKQPNATKAQTLKRARWCLDHLDDL